MKIRGYTLVELLISVAILLLLMTAVSAAIIGLLHIEAIHADRASLSRSASELATRLDEEARSSTAVFIPTTDVLGNPNAGDAPAHEVDFFRRRSDGGNDYVAYRVDTSTNSIIRYEYQLLGSGKTILTSDSVADGVASFEVQREPVADTGMVVGQPAPAQVTILYGQSQLAGGNDIIIADILSKPISGIPSHLYSVHLASRAAPTSLAILAPAATPPASPPSSRVFPFVVLRPGFPVTPPHGPLHGGGSGGPPSLLHWVAAEGSIAFLSPGTGNTGTWFDLSSAFRELTTGVYAFPTSDGGTVTVSVSCAQSLCPPFDPVPINAPGVTPPGGVVFQLVTQ